MIEFLSECWQLFVRYDSLYFKGVMNTLWLSLLGTLFGLILGFALSSLRQITIKKTDTLLMVLWKRLIRGTTYFYIEFVRGTPMVAQAVFLYYGLRQVIGWTPMVAGLIIVSLNTTAYMAEIIRSGIQSIDRGQSEAAYAIGMTQSQTFIFIILPQAIRNAFPSIGNEFIVNIKDTSMLNVIMVTDLFFHGMSVAGSTYNYAGSMFIIVVLYFIMTFTLTNLLRLIENRLRHNSQEVHV